MGIWTKVLELAVKWQKLSTLVNTSNWNKSFLVQIVIHMERKENLQANASYDRKMGILNEGKLDLPHDIAAYEHFNLANLFLK